MYLQCLIRCVGYQAQGYHDIIIVVQEQVARFLEKIVLGKIHIMRVHASCSKIVSGFK